MPWFEYMKEVCGVEALCLAFMCSLRLMADEAPLFGGITEYSNWIGLECR